MSSALAEAPVETTSAKAPSPPATASPAPSTPTPEVEPATAEMTPEQFQAYRRKVYATACKVITDHSWCSEANQYLNRMGLPNRGSVRVPMEVSFTRTLWVPVPALDGEDALSIAQEDDEAMRSAVEAAVAENIGSTAVATGWTVKPEALAGEPKNPEVGSWDFTNQGTATETTCGQYRSSRGYCTRRPHHSGQHAIGNGRTIIAVWGNRTSTRNTDNGSPW